MTEEKSHRACVQGWVQASAGLSPERLVEAFEHVFARLWQRSHRTLGGVTLAAIVDRVLHTAAERFPVLASLEVREDTGLQCQGLHEWASRERRASLEPAVEFLLVEFLRLLGSLTAEVLTPALHAVLTPGSAATGEPASPKSQDAKGSE